jgi:hypothetical protein
MLYIILLAFPSILPYHWRPFPRKKNFVHPFNHSVSFCSLILSDFLILGVIFPNIEPTANDNLIRQAERQNDTQDIQKLQESTG